MDLIRICLHIFLVAPAPHCQCSWLITVVSAGHSNGQALGGTACAIAVVVLLIVLQAILSAYRLCLAALHIRPGALVFAVIQCACLMFD